MIIIRVIVEEDTWSVHKQRLLNNLIKMLMSHQVRVHILIHTYCMPVTSIFVAQNVCKFYEITVNIMPKTYNHYVYIATWFMNKNILKFFQNCHPTKIEYTIMYCLMDIMCIIICMDLSVLYLHT